MASRADAEERDRSGRWNTLRDSIHNVWPNLKEWVMKHNPDEDNYHRFTWADPIGVDEEACKVDRYIATKHSSSERVGFFMSPNAYMAACALVQDLAGHNRDLGCLLGAGANPFFIIYACANCGISLPHRFNLELFWRHLDATLRPQCWLGLGANRAFMI
ncbi:hypothetical protein BC826DRAFT_1106319 [Russula brevipes]|nr:hypothetical protein BC826DRAFT_1106319 [Russula brevipes]